VEEDVLMGTGFLPAKKSSRRFAADATTSNTARISSAETGHPSRQRFIIKHREYSAEQNTLEGKKKTCETSKVPLLVEFNTL
jgi:hypothetical protein